MDIIHLTAECYPVAKAGGLGRCCRGTSKVPNLNGAYMPKWLCPCTEPNFCIIMNGMLILKEALLWATGGLIIPLLKKRHNTLGFELYLLI